MPSAGVALGLNITANTPKQTVEWLEIDGPANTTTLTERSSPIASSSSCKASIRGRDRALRAPGRLSVKVATPSASLRKRIGSGLGRAMAAAVLMACPPVRRISDYTARCARVQPVGKGVVVL